MGYVHDRVSSGGVEKGDMSVTALSGERTPGGKGVIDLALLKFVLNRACLTNTMDALWSDPKAKEMLRSATGGFRAYRNHFGWPGDEEQKANPWMVLIPASLQEFSELHRRMVYCVDYDGVLNNLCRAGNSAEYVSDEPPFKAMMMR